MFTIPKQLCSLIPVIAVSVCLCEPTSEAFAQKQGGGAFTSPAKNKPAKTVPKKSRKTLSISGNWDYRVKCSRKVLSTRGSYNLGIPSQGRFTGTFRDRTSRISGSVNGRINGRTITLTDDYIDLLGQAQRSVWTGQLSANEKQITMSGGGKWSKGCTMTVTRK